MPSQATIQRQVALEGIGLHSGQPSKIVLAPADADTGITFRARDAHRTRVPARRGSIVDSRYATTLGVNGARIRTVEHLLAATAALGIDNLLVEVEGEEIPAMDGSAEPFVSLLYGAGKAELDAPRWPLRISESIRVGDEARWLMILPSDVLRVSYTLDVDHPAVGMQTASFTCTEEVFVREVASARTYGFLKDVGTLRRNGLAKGGSLDNAVVVGRRAVLNSSLRYRDEFVRHKVLDLIGDLALLGRPVIGHVVARNAGHSLNHELIHAIAEVSASDPVAVALGAAARPEGVHLEDEREPLPGIAAL